MTEAANEGELTKSVGDELSSFIEHIDSLSSTLELTTMVIRASGRLAREKYKEFSDQHTIPSSEVVRKSEVAEDSAHRSILVKSTRIGEFRKLQCRISNTRIAYETVPVSFLVSLISQYDAFLGRLLRFVFLVKPEVLNTSDKNLSFSDLVSFGSVDNAREYIIEKEVEGVLRKSHTDQFDYLENKFKMPFKKDLDVWPDFVEITERRNLFVHTDGVISSQYVKVCLEHGVTLDDEEKVGKRLGVSSKYFGTAFDTVYEIGVKLAHVVWRKFQPEERVEADRNLNSLAYDLIEEGRYKLAITILNFATQTLKIKGY